MAYCQFGLVSARERAGSLLGVVRMVEGSWRAESSLLLLLLLLLLQRRRYVERQINPRLSSRGDGISGVWEDHCHEENRERLGRLGNIFPKLIRDDDEDLEMGSMAKRDLGDESIIFFLLLFIFCFIFWGRVDNFFVPLSNLLARFGREKEEIREQAI